MSRLIICTSLCLLLFGCNNTPQLATTTPNPNATVVTNAASASIPEYSYRNLPDGWNDYWYAGLAEINTYDIIQNRYGQERTGEMVHIFVTEPFEPTVQIKADRPADDNLTVLKLNATRSFYTGIYPYNLMTSTFSDVQLDKPVVKTTSSVTEWCGQTFAQLNNRGDLFDLRFSSYFQSEGDTRTKIDASSVENAVYNEIRMSNAEQLVDVETMLPSFEYLQMFHKEMKGYAVDITLNNGPEYNKLSLNYPSLNRDVQITFTSDFPHRVSRIVERVNGSVQLQAQVKASERLPYWNLNKPEDASYRETLMLND